MVNVKKAFDGFNVNLSVDDDGDWQANLLELPNVSAFAESPEEALKELETAWEAMKKSYRKHGEAIPLAPSKKEYSGQFNVRVGKDIHRALVMKAAQEDISLNALVAQTLAAYVKARRVKR